MAQPPDRRLTKRQQKDLLEAVEKVGGDPRGFERLEVTGAPEWLRVALFQPSLRSRSETRFASEDHRDCSARCTAARAKS